MLRHAVACRGGSARSFLFARPHLSPPPPLLATLYPNCSMPCCISAYKSGCAPQASKREKKVSRIGLCRGEEVLRPTMVLMRVMGGELRVHWGHVGHAAGQE